MTLDLITTQDLNNFKEEILSEIINLFSRFQSGYSTEVLKSGDVKKLLRCSDSKLESLRNSGKLLSSKVGGTLYYKLADVEALLNSEQ